MHDALAAEWIARRNDADAVLRRLKNSVWRERPKPVTDAHIEAMVEITQALEDVLVRANVILGGN